MPLSISRTGRDRPADKHPNQAAAGPGASMFHRSGGSNQRSGVGAPRGAGQDPPQLRLQDILAECLLSGSRAPICALPEDFAPPHGPHSPGREKWQQGDHSPLSCSPFLFITAEVTKERRGRGPGMRRTQIMTEIGHSSSREAKD